MNIRLLLDFVLIDPTPVEEQTAAGIILVKSETNKAPTSGIVIIVGPGRHGTGTFIETTVKSGDKVMWHKFAGAEMVIEGKSFILMHESDLTCVIE